MLNVDQQRDPVTVVLRQGASLLLHLALEAEAQGFLERYQQQRDARGRLLVVRNGAHVARTIDSPFGPLQVRPPRLLCRHGSNLHFASAITPPYQRTHTLIPHLFRWFYCQALRSRSCDMALPALLGPRHCDLAPSLQPRLRGAWQAHAEHVMTCPLTDHLYQRFWLGALSRPLDDGSGCDTNSPAMLVAIGLDAERTDLLAVGKGWPDSVASWTELVAELRDRGLQRLSLRRLMLDSSRASRLAIEHILPGSMAPTEIIDTRDLQTCG